MSRLGCLSLLLPLSLGGCLFVGDVNDRPSVTMSAVTMTGPITRGEPITLSAFVRDDQVDTALALVVRDVGGAVVDDPCAVAITDLGRNGAAQQYEVVLWTAGTYTIGATATDRLGATSQASGSTATVVLTVTDGKPTFTKASAQLRLGKAVTPCTGLYPTGRPILVALDSPVYDPEQSWRAPPAGCEMAQPAPALAYTWHLVGRPTGSGAALGRTTNGVCPPAPLDPAIDLPDDDPSVCLYPDPNLPTSMPSMYSIELAVTDGSNVQTSDTLGVPVIGDAPACLDGAYPAVGSYVLDRGVPTVFQAVGVDDVSDPSTLTFVWSLARAGATSFTPLDTPIAAADGGARLVFDPGALGLAVGDQLRLRVDIDDPASAGPACDPADDACAAASCAAAPAATCPRRATWSLEIR